MKTKDKGWFTKRQMSDLFGLTASGFDAMIRGLGIEDKDRWRAPSGASRPVFFRARAVIDAYCRRETAKRRDEFSTRRSKNWGKTWNLC